MCRYGMSTYKEPFACFDCRKSFKQTNYYELPEHVKPASAKERIVKCPQCGNQMANMGHDFKPPKQTNIKQWKKVQILWEHGYTFHSCGCCGPGFRPSELKDVEEFINENTSKSDGEILLNNIIEKLTSKGITHNSNR